MATFNDNLFTSLIAASYERVSSDEQAKEGFSLEVQSEKNAAYIKAQGWQYGGTYIDPGKSGKNLNRPEMKRLLADIQANKLNVVVVHKLDRLTRNVGDLHQLLSLFDKKEVKLVSITENIDTTTAMGRMFVYMLGIFAQWYRENLSEEVVKGQTKRAQKGLRNTSTRPYGYSVNPEDLSLEIIPEEAEVVRQVYKWYNAGWGKIKIAKVLNTEGIHGDPIPCRGGGKWYESIIGDMVKNPTYMGATHWKRKEAPESERIIVEDVHEPIISKEEFDKTQYTSKRRTEDSMSTSSHDFPFSTIIKCGECGRSYHGKQNSYNTPRPRNAVRFYRCSGRYRVNPCKHSDVSETKLVDVFLKFLDTFDFKATEPDKSLESKDVERERKRLTKLISDSATKRKNYARAMGSGKIDYDTFVELADEEERKVQAWNEELAKMESISKPTSKKTRKDIVTYINNLKSNWFDMDYLEQKYAVQQLFEILVIKRDDEKTWHITGYKLAD